MQRMLREYESHYRALIAAAPIGESACFER